VKACGKEVLRIDALGHLAQLFAQADIGVGTIVNRMLRNGGATLFLFVVLATH